MTTPRITDPAAAGMATEALAAIDALLLGDIAKGRNFGSALLVARGGVTHAADLRVAGTQLARTKLLGVVLLDGEGG